MIFQCLIICTVVLHVNSITSLDQQWIEFKKKHKRNYDVKDDKIRFRIFQDNVALIEKHNRDFIRGIISYRKGMNQFADLKKEEFIKQLTVSKINSTDQGYDDSELVETIQNYNIPKQFDWRKSGAVTNVKDQGDCGSCWTFSTTGSLEAQYFLKNGELINLSEQNLIDCANDYEEINGCDGGWMSAGFQYIIDQGINKEEEYPYEGEIKECRYDENNTISISGYKQITNSTEDEFKSVLASVGPLSAALDASNLQFYSGGVYVDEECSGDKINHGVLIVGYGVENGKDYWLVKNSWGPNWGEEGYFKIARNRNNHCNITSYGLYPLL